MQLNKVNKVVAEICPLLAGRCLTRCKVMKFRFATQSGHSLGVNFRNVRGRFRPIMFIHEKTPHSLSEWPYQIFSRLFRQRQLDLCSEVGIRELPLNITPEFPGNIPLGPRREVFAPAHVDAIHMD